MRDMRIASLPISLEERRERNGHASGILWFTGHSGTGRATLAVGLERRLFHRG
ncbi:MAG: adenylyl-sulfate kinase [Rhodospirillales bacterium]|nr:adenylyl-sulfate kinase [Rhodospirillales bacterium]